MLLLIGILTVSLTACVDKEPVKSVNSKPESSKVVEQSNQDKTSSSEEKKDSTEKKEVTQTKKDKSKAAKKADGSNDKVPLKTSNHTKSKSIEKTNDSSSSLESYSSPVSQQVNHSSNNNSNTPKQSINNTKPESDHQVINKPENNNEKTKTEVTPKVESKPEQKSESQQNNVQPQPLIAETNLAKRTNQILTVVASGIHAHITLWTKNGDTWGKSLETNGFVGKYGIGTVHEGSMRTPYGAYSLDFAFGTSNPGTKLPFRQITSKSWWVEDSNDPNYNTWQEGDHFNKPSEHLADYPVQYKYAVVINYNTARTPWAGSGFFVHVSNGSYTAGCVSLPESQMVRLLNTLAPGAYILNVTSESQIKGF
ncbi:L,D-transpeptidase family protein [Sporolactobacillus nakayamae]|uniref:L,D-peptidoglycan transpeptidase YkuD, ErfK/YbiS/YcfS/YnhG family n=1 Tax=Sporolactobacillus nakayamae TaxID=269670 RepID=A0A1I2T6H1_9BACL|nr:S-layer protein [Sporolactobacillus nakayamae]SFG59709.1 L,D-peptidoglycan transpeptidase YkuD, ErfK/YbiS/YcfS/YnhG family [Sporolactobacillus nakayamae]